MGLSSDLISQFIKATNDEKKTESEATLYGTTVEYNGSIYVQLDGSELLTPVSKTADAKPDERVTVRIKNHTATIIGNASSPSARTGDVQDLGDKVTEVDNLVTETVLAVNGKFENLDATYATIEKLEAEYASIEHLEANYATIEKLEAEYASIDKLEADYASIEHLEANYATIDDLKSINIDTESLKATYAQIDFANIGEAAIENFFSKSGMIDDLVVSDGRVTGTLVGVTIIGDLIKGGTVQADKLVIKGEDGLYYKLNVEGGATTSEQVTEEDLQNGLSGSIIVAKSITAEKVAVDDLVAFGATIGGFHITADSLYSGVKASVDNTTRGIYQDTDGQFAVGDAYNFLKFYQDTDGTYKLAISASSMTFSSTGRNVEETIADAQNAANDAQTTADNATTRITSAESTIQQLVDSLSALVRDGNGGSLVRQDSDGLWYFDISGIEESLSDTANDLDDLTGVVLDANGEIDVLKSTAEALQARTEYVRSYTDENDQPCLELGEGDSVFKVKITNTDIQFMEDTDSPARINRKMLIIEKTMVKKELQFGDDEETDIKGVWTWKRRSNGNLGLSWKGVGS